MSLPENRDSPMEQYKQSRFKINNLFGFSQTQKNDWCPGGCARLKPYHNNGLICPKCGKIITRKQPQRNTSKLTLKSGTGSGAPFEFVISQNKPKRKAKHLPGNEDLTEEDITDLKAGGITPTDIRDYAG